MKIAFAYTGIRVRSLPESVEFYTKGSGMKVVGESAIEQTGGRVVNLVSEDGGFPLELNHYGSSSKYNTEYAIGEGLDHLAFGTGDLKGLLERANGLGYPVTADLRTDSSRWVYIYDPNGIWIELFQAP